MIIINDPLVWEENPSPIDVLLVSHLHSYDKPGVAMFHPPIANEPGQLRPDLIIFSPHKYLVIQIEKFGAAKSVSLLADKDFLHVHQYHSNSPGELIAKTPFPWPKELIVFPDTPMQSCFLFHYNDIECNIFTSVERVDTPPQVVTVPTTELLVGLINQDYQDSLEHMLQTLYPPPDMAVTFTGADINTLMEVLELPQLSSDEIISAGFINNITTPTIENPDISEEDNSDISKETATTDTSKTATEHTTETELPQKTPQNSDAAVPSETPQSEESTSSTTTPETDSPHDEEEPIPWAVSNSTSELASHTLEPRTPTEEQDEAPSPASNTPATPTTETASTGDGAIDEPQIGPSTSRIRSSQRSGRPSINISASGIPQLSVPSPSKPVEQPEEIPPPETHSDPVNAPSSEEENTTTTPSETVRSADPHLSSPETEDTAHAAPAVTETGDTAAPVNNNVETEDASVLSDNSSPESPTLPPESADLSHSEEESEHVLPSELADAGLSPEEIQEIENFLHNLPPEAGEQPVTHMLLDSATVSDKQPSEENTSGSPSESDQEISEKPIPEPSTESFPESPEELITHEPPSESDSSTTASATATVQPVTETETVQENHDSSNNIMPPEESIPSSEPEHITREEPQNSVPQNPDDTPPSHHWQDSAHSHSARSPIPGATEQEKTAIEQTTTAPTVTYDESSLVESLDSTPQPYSGQTNPEPGVLPTPPQSEPTPAASHREETSSEKKTSTAASNSTSTTVKPPEQIPSEILTEPQSQDTYSTTTPHDLIDSQVTPPSEQPNLEEFITHQPLDSHGALGSTEEQVLGESPRSNTRTLITVIASILGIVVIAAGIIVGGGFLSQRKTPPAHVRTAPPNSGRIPIKAIDVHCGKKSTSADDIVRDFSIENPPEHFQPLVCHQTMGLPGQKLHLIFDKKYTITSVKIYSGLILGDHPTPGQLKKAGHHGNVRTIDWHIAHHVFTQHIHTQHHLEEHSIPSASDNALDVVFTTIKAATHPQHHQSNFVISKIEVYGYPAS